MVRDGTRTVRDGTEPLLRRALISQENLSQDLQSNTLPSCRPRTCPTGISGANRHVSTAGRTTTGTEPVYIYIYIETARRLRRLSSWALSSLQVLRQSMMLGVQAEEGSEPSPWGVRILPRVAFGAHPSGSDGIPPTSSSVFVMHHFMGSWKVGTLTIHTAPLTIHTAHLTIHTAPLTIHTAPLTIHTAPLTIHTAPLTIHTAPLTVHTAPLPVHTAPLTIHTAPLTVHTAPLTVHTAPTAGERRVEGEGQLEGRQPGGALARAA
eukprot:6251322-Pyramimonas_sp.AAC.1